MSTITREGVDSLSIDRGEPDWLKTLRINAWEKYLQTPAPTIKHDAWRKTRLEKLNLAKINTSSPKSGKPDAQSKCDVLSRFEERSGAIYSTTENSWLVDLDPELKKAGVIFEPLDAALKNDSAKLEEWIKKIAEKSSTDKFELMQEALFNCGAFLYIPKDLVVEKPFVIINRVQGSESGASLFPRVLVKAAPHSKASIINAFVSDSYDKSNGKELEDSKLSLINSRTDLHAECGAQISFIEVQALSESVFLINKTASKVDKDANCTSLTVGISGYQLKSEIVTSLVEPGADGAMLGVVLGDGTEHLSYNTLQDHDAPNTTSDINFRVALKDQSVSAYQGNIKVAKEAQKTCAYQTNKNLLLGKDAKADSIPKLEILANDVKCSHGATVGPVDQNQVFYLMSRGLDQKTAEELIVAGFFDTVLEALPDKVANDWIHDLIREKIHSQ